MPLHMVAPDTGPQYCGGLALRVEQQDRASRASARGEEGLTVPISLLATAKSVHLRLFAGFEVKKKESFFIAQWPIMKQKI